MLNGNVTSRTGCNAGWLTDDDADAHAREAIRLGKRSTHEDVRVLRHVGYKTLAAELDIGLINQHDRVSPPLC
jgi:hypothetical protein